MGYRIGGFSVCKWCGARISWGNDKKPYHGDGTKHDCKPKVKIFTKEEIAKLNKERNQP